MLGHAITTELQLLAARERAADLAGVFPSRVPDSTRDEVVRLRGARPPAGRHVRRARRDPAAGLGSPLP